VTEEETLVLTRYVKACCPQQTIDRYTPDAWYKLLKDLEFADCERAVDTVANRQPFVAANEIRAEVRKMRDARLARTPLPAPPAELTDQPGRYQRIVKANIERVAAGLDVAKALEGPPGAPLAGEPPEEWQQAREAIAPMAPPRPDPRDVAREQVEESRRQREGQEAS
jgi:hypothetical protein